jgi:hypothetical protein
MQSACPGSRQIMRIITRILIALGLLQFCLAASIDQSDELEYLVFFERPKDGFPKGRFSEKQQKEWVRSALDKIPDITARLIQIYTDRLPSLPPEGSARVLTLLGERPDLTTNDVTSLRKAVEQLPDYEIPRFHQFMAVKYFLLFLKNHPGEENRQYALKHLQNEQGTVAVAAIEALASIGRPEDADACLAVAQARMKASEAAYFDTYRNLLNTAYNLFARRLGRPELPVSRDLEPIEFELARKLPVEVATPLVKKIVYMSAEDGIRLLKEAGDSQPKAASSSEAAIPATPNRNGETTKDNLIWHIVALGIVLSTALALSLISRKRP